MIKRALISVSDKTGVAEFARFLADKGVDILSTGGTAKLFKEQGIPCREVSELTGFPECLDGRVKTLHPKVHGGILAMRSNPEHQKTVEDLNISLIDCIVVNLYPFKQTVMKPGVEFAECVENIDIGGPTMLRSAAKNHNDVTVIVDPADYTTVCEQMDASGDTDAATRFYLARKVFEHTAAYDSLIAQYFLSVSPEKELPKQYTMTYEKVSALRYGENGHQKATFYRNAIPMPGTLSEAVQHNGKELSYNNISDTDGAIACLKEFTEPTVVAVKHANPCGIGCGATIEEAWDRAYEADPVSIFGGIIAANREIDEITAKKMLPIFLEVIVAPSFTQAALDLFSSKKNLRVLSLPGVGDAFAAGTQALKFVSGGLLVQDADLETFDPADLKVVTQAPLDPAYMDDIAFGMTAVKYVKSNGIAIVRDRQTLGIGPGQVNRIGAARIALEMAGEKSRGAVLASDAFFPFRDCVDAAAAAGIRVIVQPGGSLKDQDSIDACNEHGITMVFTGMRHFRHG